MAAILLSLKVAAVATLGLLPVGIGLGWLLARSQFRGKTLVDGLIHLPLVLPPVVTGYLLLIAFGRRGLIGAWLHDVFGLTFSFRWTGAALAAAVMALPVTVRAIRLAMEQQDHRLVNAAATLGASPLRAFFTITLPLAFPGLFAGAVLTFVKSLGEFGATITFVSSIPGETETLSLHIYGLLQVPGGEAAALRLSFIAILLSLSALGISEWLARRMRRSLGGAS